ncbi:MAG: hypothetical protein ACERKZ_10435 [Lachnotalea sp.]
MKIKALTMGIIIFIVVFGGIGATIVLDVWVTTSDKTPVKIKEGEAEGNYNPADIRGSYTFSDVSELFEIELPVLYTAFNIRLDTVGTEIQVKKLESLYEDSGYEIGTESLRIFVALYKKLPIDLDGSFLPKQAAELILQVNENLSQEQISYLETYAVDVTAINTSEAISPDESSTDEKVNETETSAAKTSETESTENVVTGSATFQKVLDAGVTKEEIEEILGTSMPPTNQTVKDYCIEVGLSFSDIKKQLNDKID